MVKLSCAIVGEAGSAFTVDVDPSQLVHDLKELIKGKNPATITCDAMDLQLFLAKKMTEEGKGKGPWLVTNEVESGWSETSDLKPLNALVALKLYGLSETGVQLLVPLTLEDADAGRTPVHVLVELPEGVAKTMSPAMMTFVEKMFAEIFVKVVPSTVPSKRKPFKKSLLNYYGYYDSSNQRRDTYGFPKKKTAIRCMLTNDLFPESIVIASHLFRHGWKSYAKEAMDLDDIDDPKNGLLLFTPLKKAFDEYRISFLYNRSSEKYELKVVDSLWKDKTLISVLDAIQLKELRSYGRKSAYNYETTFGSLEGSPLILRPDKLPYNRCLNFQARIARQYALKFGHMKDDEPDFQDFWSDTFAPSEKIEWLVQSISDMSVNPDLRGEFFDFDLDEEKPPAKSAKDE